MSEAAPDRRTILVVEDDPDIAESLCDVLHSEGYEVATASNGREGLDRLREISRPCLILLDLMMPVMSGSEFLEALRHDQDDALACIPVVIVSAWTDESAQVLAQGVVKKPVSIDALLEATHKLCAPEVAG